MTRETMAVKARIVFRAEVLLLKRASGESEGWERRRGGGEGDGDMKNFVGLSPLYTNAHRPKAPDAPYAKIKIPPHFCETPSPARTFFPFFSTPRLDASQFACRPVYAGVWQSELHPGLVEGGSVPLNGSRLLALGNPERA